MEGFVGGRYFEEWENQGMSIGLEVEKKLYEDESEHQEIIVFKSTNFGNVLVVDETIQCTERDEFPYHEMMAHLPLFSHPNPKKVLVIGGGDGGAIREITKHDIVEEVHQCELDKCIIEVSKKYLPKMSTGYSSTKLVIHVDDGAMFLDNCTEEFDIIITDCSDYDTEPSKLLYEREYYEKLYKALKPNGILCSLAECAWTDMEFLKKFRDTIQSVFPVVQYAFGVFMPVYIGGQCGFYLAGKNKDINFEKPTREVSKEELKRMDLRYYNKEIHQSAFVLPQFAKEAFKN